MVVLQSHNSVSLFVMQVLTRIRGFAAMNRLKKEALKVIAGNLPMDEIVGLKEMFHAMDKDGRSIHRKQTSQRHSTCSDCSLCPLCHREAGNNIPRSLQNNTS